MKWNFILPQDLIKTKLVFFQLKHQILNMIFFRKNPSTMIPLPNTTSIKSFYKEIKKSITYESPRSIKLAKASLLLFLRCNLTATFEPLNSFTKSIETQKFSATLALQKIEEKKSVMRKTSYCRSDSPIVWFKFPFMTIIQKQEQTHRST